MSWLWMKFWSFVWWFCETFDIKLGRAAPRVFGWAIGSRGKLCSRWEPVRTGRGWALLRVDYCEGDPIPFRGDGDRWWWFRSRRDARKAISEAMDQFDLRGQQSPSAFGWPEWACIRDEEALREAVAEARSVYERIRTTDEEDWLNLWGEHMLEAAVYFMKRYDEED